LRAGTIVAKARMKNLYFQTVPVLSSTFGEGWPPGQLPGQIAALVRIQTDDW